jgi:hypothetical protein
LTRYFSWLLKKEGPEIQETHYATARRELLSQSDNWVLNSSCTVRNEIIGSGSGFSIGMAKRTAASQALQYLRSLPAEDPIFSLSPNVKTSTSHSHHPPRYIFTSAMGKSSFHRCRIPAFENTIQTLYATSTIFLQAIGMPMAT